MVHQPREGARVQSLRHCVSVLERLVELERDLCHATLQPHWNVNHAVQVNPIRKIFISFQRILY